MSFNYSNLSSKLPSLSVPPPHLILLSIVGLIFTIYGLILVISLTRTEINSEDEVEYVSNVLNISKILSLVILCLLVAIVGVGFAFPPVLQVLSQMKVLYGIIFISMLILTLVSWFLHADVLKENPIYGVTGKENIIDAKKDYLIRFGITITIIGFASLGYVIFSMLKVKT